MPLKVGVRIETAFTTGGEFLADISALDASGADSIWLDAGDGHSAAPWIVLGAIAAITRRVRLGILGDAAMAWPDAIALMGRLTGGRLVVGVTARHQGHEPAHPSPLLLIVCDTYADAKRSATLAGGVIFPGSPDDVRALRAEGVTDSEVWVNVAMPKDRAAWAAATQANEAAGATGMIVRWDPRIIDLLRSAGEPDDRTDLLIATG